MAVLCETLKKKPARLAENVAEQLAAEADGRRVRRSASFLRCCASEAHRTASRSISCKPRKNT